MERKKIIKLLKNFVSIQSVSTDKSRYSEILKAVGFLTDKLKKLGFKIKIFKEDGSPPLIIAQKEVVDAKKTIGIYGHYDVQPEDPVKEWICPPFELTARGGKFYGRGVADNKGHIIQNISSIKQLIKADKLTNNIIFIFEGEEESSSLHFEKYVRQAKEILNKIDVFYLTDMGMHQKNVPQIFYGLRGNIYFELKIIIGSHDLHSGVYGNRVLNPISVLADIISKIKDSESGKILIPHFYDQVRKLTPKELLLLTSIAKNEAAEKKEAGVFGLTSMNEKRPYLSTKTYPSFDPHGLSSGFTQEGEKTIIPRSAKAKFSFRLVGDQEPEKIEKLVKDFVAKNLPKEIRYELNTLSKSSPFYTDIENCYVEETRQVLEQVFDNKCLLNRSGGSVPAAGTLQKLFKKPIILTGFTLPDDNLHAPNENFDEDSFWKGMDALKKIYSD